MRTKLISSTLDYQEYKQNNIFKYLNIILFIYLTLFCFTKTPQLFMVHISNFSFVQVTTENNHSIDYYAAAYKAQVGAIITANQIVSYEDFNKRKTILIPIQDGLYSWRKGELIGRSDDSFDRLLSDKYIGLYITSDGVLGGVMTSDYGYRKHPFTRRKSFHSGWDIGAYKNTPIFLNLDNAIVIKTSYHRYYGNVVELFSNGFKLVLAHLSKILVEEGDIITNNTIVGLVGSTGRSTGNHLHFEVRHLNNKKWKAVDPISFFIKPGISGLASYMVARAIK